MQQKVAVEEHQKAQIEQRIREADIIIAQAFEDQKRHGQGPLNLSQLQNFPDYVWRLKQNRFQQFQALQQQEKKLTEVRKELHQALIKQKSLETLKEKDYTQYRHRLDKAEEEFMAEIALNRSRRQAF